MRRSAKLLALLLLALAPAALMSATPTSAPAADRNERGQGRGQAPGQERKAERQAERGAPFERRMPPGQARAPDYSAPAYRGAPAPRYDGYANAPAPYPAYPSAPVYAAPPPGAYSYAPPPGYAPNSLGAGWGQQQDQARSAVRQGRMMPLGQVMQQIRRGTPGRLLDAGLEPGPDGRPAYRVRWAATGGRRIDFIVDAVTGAIVARTGY
jgi:hypothetical protein